MIDDLAEFFEAVGDFVSDNYAHLTVTYFFIILALTVK